MPFFGDRDATRGGKSGPISCPNPQQSNQWMMQPSPGDDTKAYLAGPIKMICESFFGTGCSQSLVLVPYLIHESVSDFKIDRGNGSVLRTVTGVGA